MLVHRRLSVWTRDAIFQPPSKIRKRGKSSEIRGSRHVGASGKSCPLSLKWSASFVLEPESGSNIGQRPPFIVGTFAAPQPFGKCYKGRNYERLVQAYLWRG